MASSPSSASRWVQAIRSWGISAISSHTALWSKSRNGRVGQAGLLGGADAVLGAGAGAVAALEFDRVAVEVGQREQEAMPVVVCEAQLGAGVRAFATHDQPRPLGPGAQIHAVGDLGHPRPV